MIKFAAVLKDHAVLQREKKVILWGTTDQKEVWIELKDASDVIVCKVEAAVSEGRFEVSLPPVSAGGPYSITASAKSEKNIIDDIYFGEVWLAGGQSNMELELQNSDRGAEEVKNANDPLVRFYYTQKVSWVGEELFEAEERSCWQLCEPGVPAAWSAVAYYFAKDLAKKLGVMVGIIGCNWGGTSASCWVDRDSLAENDKLKTYVEAYDKATEDQDPVKYDQEWQEYLEYQSGFDKRLGEYYSTYPNPNWDEAIKICGENRYPGPMGPKNFTRPCGLYESMLRRVVPYTLAGFIYYQGEEDDNRPYIYRDLMETLIRVWRRDFKGENLPFILTQLPVFVNEGEDDFKNWPFIREAQADVTKSVPDTWMAVILDKGEFHNIHPTDKKTVGDRLAEIALSKVYDMGDESGVFAPEYSGFRIEDGKIYISFEHCKGGLKASQDEPEDTAEWGFEIAGDDNIYEAATVEIKDNGEVILSSPKIESPAKARYFWKNYAPVYIFGQNGLPLAPFRTDRNDGAIALGSRQGELKI